MSDITLYAWGRPLSQDGTPIVSNLDHTWITSFPETVDPTHQPDPPAGYKPPKYYWYSWGTPHDVASHALGSASGEFSTAYSISPANETAIPANAPHYSPSTTSGAIVYYGLDGVCHNVANEVLVATGTSSKEPLRVSQAKGYPLSTFFFGTYGLNSDTWNRLRQQYAPAVLMPGDDFLQFMFACVPLEQQAELEAIRFTAHEGLRELRKKVVENSFDFYPEVAIIAAAALYSAKKLLGDTVFFQLFPALDLEDTSWFKPAI